MVDATPVARDLPVDRDTAAAAEIARTPENEGTSPEWLLAGLAGLAGLGIAGGAAAMIRRRRRRPDVGDAAVTPVPGTPLMAGAPVASPTPAATRVPEPVKAPAFSAAPAVPPRKVDQIAGSSLIDRIDYTKPAGYYAAHVDAGPTPINPFLTRTNRLRRARFLDSQLERRAAREALATPVASPKTRERALEPA